MSASIFETKDNALRTYRLERDENNEPLFKIVIKGTGGSTGYDNDKQDTLLGIVQQVRLTTKTRTQWTYTLGKDIYAYTFGDSTWSITVTGLGYIKCKEKENGFDKAVEFYVANNIAVKGEPCIVILGNKTFKAYLTSLNIGTTHDPKISGIFPFQLSFTGLLV